MPVQRAPVWLSVDGGPRPPSPAINLIPEQETPEQIELFGSAVIPAALARLTTQPSVRSVL